MSLLDDISVPPTSGAPKGWHPSSVWDGNEGEIVSAATLQGAGQPVFDDLLREHDLDPEKVEVVGNVRTSRWQRYDKEWLVAYRFNIRQKREAIDLPALYAEVRKTRIRPRKLMTGESTAVVVWADLQVGKQDSRGGTLELLERLETKRDALRAYLKSSGSSRGLFVDVGDGVESFENVASQAHLNDLSFPDQIDTYATETWKTQALMANFFPVDSMIVPSNHSAWRNGKQILGKPGDDWGMHVHKRLQEKAGDRNADITYHFPNVWDESLTLDVRGTMVGAHHGHQCSSGSFAKWWADQQHGGQPLARADIALSGHYHSLNVQPTGRNAFTGKSKWHLQAPTLDNGSSWYRNKAGADSDPGMLVFVIDNDGFNLQSLAVL